MHAYRMQQLIKERYKDDVINVAQRNSVYQTIDRLLRDGLIIVRETLRQWMRTMLSTPAREFPEFPAALAFLPVLRPDEVADALDKRAAAPAPDCP